MKINFNDLKEEHIAKFAGGEGEVIFRRYIERGEIKIMQGTVKKGNSVGLHTHKQNREVLYVISGEGHSICDGVDQTLRPGEVLYCPMGHEHTLINEKDEDLVFLAVVPEYKSNTL